MEPILEQDEPPANLEQMGLVWGGKIEIALQVVKWLWAQDEARKYTCKICPLSEEILLNDFAR
jgi:hypothetical protein